MVAVIRVDAYTFLAFSDLTFHRMQEYVFSGCTVPPDNKKNKLGSSDQEASPSAGKNTEVVLVSCRTRKCVPIAISGGVDTSVAPGCQLL